MKVSLWLDEAIAVAAFAALLATTPAVLSLERDPVAVLDDDNAWYRRHERNSRECRGQQYIAVCCEHARTDLTCIDANLKWSRK